MYAPYPFFAIVPELLPKNVAGGAMALINSMGALGSFVAVLRRLPERATGCRPSSYAFMSAALVAAVILTLSVKPQARDTHPATGSPVASYAFMSAALVAAVILTLSVKPQARDTHPLATLQGK